MNIKFITSNAAKVALAQERLASYGVIVEHAKFDLEEVRSMDVEEVAKDKASQAMKLSKDPFIIEDSAFCIEALNGFPGTFINMTFDTLGDERIAKLLQNETNKKAYVKSILAYGDPKTGEIITFTGIYDGEIADKPRGDNMRGWKVVRIFIPKKWNKTLAELNDQEWKQFLDDFRKGDHFEKFGQWASHSK